MAEELFTSESVSSGHPDKLCDAISDAIVDACLSVDYNARVAVETSVKGGTNKGIILLAGEVTLAGQHPDYESIARKTAESIGYNNHSIGFDATSEDRCEVIQKITAQAANISQGVNNEEQGAGDQGLMFGYACNETEHFDELNGRFFPLAAALSQRLTRRMTKARKDGILSLEKDLEQMRNPFFRKGIEIAINEKEVTRLRFLLVQEKDAIEDRHIAGAELYSCMAGYSPAFGMLGTVMGLVIMMNSFGGGEVEAGAAPQSTAEKFSGLLSGMAMALVTTFYGVFFANVFFTPMAGKLKRKDEMEMLHKNVIIEGVVSIKQNEHPLIIKEKLMTMVPPDVVLILQDENREVS